jgi:DNA-binding response OmpR family regulator
MQIAGDILVVDDDQPTVELIAELLTDEGYTVRAALTPSDARVLLLERRPDLVLIDLHIPGKNGDVLVCDLKDDGLAGVPILLMTADTRAAQELSMEGIAYCLVKPFDLDELVGCVAKHVRREDRAAA